MMNSKKYVLITGATSGIGYEFSKLFAADGYNLIVVARNKAALEKVAVELAQQYNIDVVKFSTDLSNTQNAFYLFDNIIALGLKVSVLINNAGQGVYGKFLFTDIERELSIIQLNISSLVILTKKFVRHMIENGGGKILNVASIAAKIPGPLQAVYHATKAFVHSFSESINEELKEDEVVVTSLLPGLTKTDFFNKAGMQLSKFPKDAKFADAATVAKDGYKALMEGRDMIVSGSQNKLVVAMASLAPDDVVADKVRKRTSPQKAKYN